MPTIYTAEAIRRQTDNEVNLSSAGAAYDPGDVVLNCVGDGRVGIVAGLEAVASADPVTFYVTGQYDVLAASGLTFAAGAAVFWDDTNHTAKTTATGGYQYIGRAVRAKVSGELFVRVELNRQVVVVAGEVTLDGSNPTPVATGLNKILSAVAVIKKATTPGDDPTVVTVDYTGTDGTLNIYAWKTDGSDPTLVASTNSTQVISWIAWGV